MNALFITVTSFVSLLSFLGGSSPTLAFSAVMNRRDQHVTFFGRSFGISPYHRVSLNMSPHEDEDDDDEEDDGDELDPLSNGIDSVTWLPSLVNQSTKTISAVRNVRDSFFYSSLFY
jgi:hypothetical protein